MAEETPKETTPTEPVVDEPEEAPSTTEAAAEDAADDAAADAGEDAAADNEGEDAPADNSRGNKSGKPFRSYRNNRAVYHQADNSDPSCRVYVGNLAWEVSWMDLKDHMTAGGCEVARADILASPDGRSKGCGIVELTSAEEAQKALLLNDTDLMGRQIFVREDRENGSGGGYYTQKSGGGAPAGGRRAGGAAPARPASGGEKQNCRVYVGNLSWEVAWQDLKDHMRDAGEVVFAEVMTEGDGRSKGCGIVEYSTPEEAKEACTTLSDTELKGRMIFVREDRETSSGGGGGGAGQQSGFRGTGTSVYVGNLDYDISWQDLKDHMRGAGNVDQANVLTNEDGSSKGCGIVVYQNARDAQRAVRELQNTELKGRPIFVREDREAGGKRGGGFRPRNKGRRGEPPASSGDVAGRQLFVGNLSYDTTWRELKDHFRQCGDVERVEVIEGPGGRKKGFGTVRFKKEEDATNAITRLDGSELQGREIKVRLDGKAR
jgi:RNA recognition motif-containing protein